MPETTEQVTEQNRLDDIAIDAFGGDDDNDGQVLQPVEPLNEEAEKVVEEVVDDSKDEAGGDKTQPEKAEEETSSESVKPEPVVPEAPVKDDKWDTQLQQYQQLNASYQNLLEKMAANPTPETQKAVEKTKTKLDLIVESKSEDVDPYDATKVVAKEVQSLLADREKQSTTSKETIATLRAQLDATNERQDRMDFQQKNPAIADDYNDLLGQLSKAVDDFRPAAGEVIPEKTWNAIVNREWKTLVDVANADATAKAEAETNTEDAVVDTVKVPVATNPIKKTKGTRSKPTPDPKAFMNELRDNAFGDFEE